MKLAQNLIVTALFTLLAAQGAQAGFCDDGLVELIKKYEQPSKAKKQDIVDIRVNEDFDTAYVRIGDRVYFGRVSSNGEELRFKPIYGNTYSVSTSNLKEMCQKMTCDEGLQDLLNETAGSPHADISMNEEADGFFVRIGSRVYVMKAGAKELVPAEVFGQSSIEIEDLQRACKN